jgi:hypothetical protein
VFVFPVQACRVQLSQEGRNLASGTEASQPCAVPERRGKMLARSGPGHTISENSYLRLISRSGPVRETAGAIMHQSTVLQIYPETPEPTQEELERMFDDVPRGFRPCSALTIRQRRFLWSQRDTHVTNDLSLEQKALRYHGGMPWFGYKASPQNWDAEVSALPEEAAGSSPLLGFWGSDGTWKKRTPLDHLLYQKDSLACVNCLARRYRTGPGVSLVVDSPP